MSDHSIIRSARFASAAGIAFSLTGSLWLILSGSAETWWSDFMAFMAGLSLFFAVVVWLVIPQQPRNKVVWLMTLSAFFGGFHVLGRAAVEYLIDDLGVVLGAGISTVPASLPDEAAWVLAGTEWMSIVALFPLLTLGLLLMPDGRWPSPRWRALGVVTSLSIVASALAISFDLRPWNTEPAGNNSVLNISFFVLIVSGTLCLVGMIVRFRSSSGFEREQIKWVVWGASLLVPVLLLEIIFGGSEHEGVFLVPFALGFVAYLASFAIAVGKYRRYDVDVVISRTLVYGTLAVFIGAVYVVIVVGVGQLIGARDNPNPVLAIGATALVAIAFQPLRRRLQRVGNRLVYGRRATPYEVLSTFSQRIAAVDSGVLIQVAKALYEGTTADSVSIWIERDMEMQLVASWPEKYEGHLRVPEDAVPTAHRRAPVLHDGEQLGSITLRLPSPQAFSPADEALLDQVAAGLGLAMRNLRLTEDLRSRVEQLRDSRRRIVAVQDLARRQLERDLHDGAQQRLVALKIKLGIAHSMAKKADLDDVEDILAGLRADTDETIDAVRDFARGIYPPLLEAEGLEVALTERVRKFNVPVTVQAAGVERYPRDVEATVYFCVLEAIYNAAKHAEARSVHVSLDDSGDLLRFEVRDDGVGFDSNSAFGDGLTNMNDRLDAIGGQLDISSAPSRGVVVSGEVPVGVGVAH